MKNIYDELPIEGWLEISKKIQRLNFNECSEKEFYNNLKRLEKSLSNTDLNLIRGTRYISKKEEIGLSALLHSIYQIESLSADSKGVLFYKKIRELLKLGIKTIEFLPVEFYTETRLEQNINGERVESLNKIFTDGEFDFYKYGRKSENIKIGNLKNANYILKFNMKRNESDKLIVVDGMASLRTFNGTTPTIKEVKKDTFPEIDEAPTRYFFDMKAPLSKQIFR